MVAEIEQKIDYINSAKSGASTGNLSALGPYNAKEAGS